MIFYQEAPLSAPGRLHTVYFSGLFTMIFSGILDAVLDILGTSGTPLCDSAGFSLGYSGSLFILHSGGSLGILIFVNHRTFRCSGTVGGFSGSLPRDSSESFRGFPAIC